MIMHIGVRDTIDLLLITIIILLRTSAIKSDPRGDDLSAQSNSANSTKPFVVVSEDQPKKKSRKLYRDLLGYTWSNFDLPDLDFYILPFLNYSSSMLVPHFSEEQVKFHWDGIMDTHRQKLNQVIRQWREKEPKSVVARMPLVAMLESLDRIPRQYYDKIRIHGGAYVNHALYFGLLSENFIDEMRFPYGELRRDIELQFKTFLSFKAKFNIAAGKIVGSGNVFLVRKPSGVLQIETMSDNDTPLMNGGYPLLVLDMWEHAWYLKHKHQRSPYADDWWMLVDWNRVSALNEYWTAYDRKKKEQEKESNDSVGAATLIENTDNQFDKEEL